MDVMDVLHLKITLETKLYLIYIYCKYEQTNIPHYLLLVGVTYNPGKNLLRQLEFGIFTLSLINNFVPSPSPAFNIVAFIVIIACRRRKSQKQEGGGEEGKHLLEN